MFILGCWLIKHVLLKESVPCRLLWSWRFKPTQTLILTVLLLVQLISWALSMKRWKLHRFVLISNSSLASCRVAGAAVAADQHFNVDTTQWPRAKSFFSDNQKQTTASQPAYEQPDPDEETEGRCRLTQRFLRGSNVARSRVWTESEQDWDRLVVRGALLLFLTFDPSVRAVTPTRLSQWNVRMNVWTGQAEEFSPVFYTCPCWGQRKAKPAEPTLMPLWSAGPPYASILFQEISFL